MTVHASTAARNAMVTAVVGRLDLNGGAGTVKIYSGTQPASGDIAPAGTLLATVALVSPSFGAPSGGTATGADPAAVSAAAAGTATWFRAADAAGNAVFDGSVSATGGGGDMQLATTALTVGVSVDITAFTVTAPA